MNSDHAPTADELPPLDEQYRKLTADLDGSDPLDADVAVRLALECRKRQLRASLQNAANLESELAIARDMIATMRARIATVEAELDGARSGNVAWESAVSGLEAHLMDRIAMDDPASPQTYLEILQADVRDVRRDTEAIRQATWARERMYCASAEAAEAKLRAVSDVLESANNVPSSTFYQPDYVDALLEGIRAILEGK